MKFNIWFEVASLLYLALIMLHSHLNRTFSSRKSIRFNNYTIVAFIDLASNILGSIFISYPDKVPLWANELTSEVFFFTQYLMAVCFMSYIKLCAGIKKPRGFLRALGWVNSFLLLTIILNPFTHWYFYFDASMQYLHGIGYYVLLSALLVNLAAAWALSFNSRGRIGAMRVPDISFQALVIIGLLSMQIVLPEILFSGAAIVLATFSVYIELQNPQNSRDALTHAFFRSSFNTLLREALEDRRYYPIIYMDIRHTHVLNKAFGENAGNELIRSIAKILMAHDRRNLVFRYTGDSFMIVIRSQHPAQDLIKEYSGLLHQSVLINGSSRSAVLQGFCFTHMDKFDDVEFLVSALEHSIKKCKMSKEEQVMNIPVQIIDEVVQRQRMEKAIKDSIADKSVKILLEPCYSVEDKAYSYANAIVAIDGLEGHEEREILETASSSGLSSALSAILLEKVAVLLSQGGFPYKSIIVKIPLSDCLKVNLAGEIEDLLDRTKADSSRLVLAITETMATLSPVIEHTIKSLKARGVSFLCDNFGVGYADLEKIAKLPFTYASLDPELSGKISSPREKAVIYRLIGLLKELGYRVAAGGFVSDSDVQLGISLGIDLVMGCKGDRIQLDL
jgi:diguanylate cyclase (GGDEF)-like protein